MIKITLPFPPSVNALYGGGSSQKRFPSKKYKEWLSNLPKLDQKIHGAVRITYRLFFTDKRTRDSKNFLKAIDDFLVKQCVIRDDDWTTLTHETIIPMGIDRQNPRIEIEILPVGT